jgi:protein-arginine kinase activator protein McsA
VTEPAPATAEDPAILAIQAKLDRAVKDERYEDAAKLRDIIKELRKLA